MNAQLSRRDFNKQLLGTACSAGLLGTALGAGTEASQKPFQLNYIVASCMYGTLPLETILQETPKTGAEYIEIWAKRHGNQREQIDELGVEKTKQLLDKYNVKLGSFTCFKYGLFNMRGEMDLVSQLGGDMVICNSGGPRGLKGAELKAGIKAFAEKLKPHIAAAEEIDHILAAPALADRVIGVEIPHNHDPRRVTDHFPLLAHFRLPLADRASNE